MSFQTKDTLDSGWDDSWTAVGQPFGALGTMGGTVIETTIFDIDAAANDKVVIYNPEAQDYETYTFLGYDGDVSKGWQFFHYDENWDQVRTSCANFTVNYGEGVMVSPLGGASITVQPSGQVADMSESATWEMTDEEWTKAIMNPYPIATTFADLETFAVANDKLYVVNCAAQDCDIYSYLGEGKGWSFLHWGSDWEQHRDNIPAASTDVVLPAGGVGYYVPVDMNGRVWTVTLEK